MSKTYDFSGWATRAGLLCGDGRTILPGAFKHQHGEKVPLVWNHEHNDPSRVLGHAILEDRDGDMRANCVFNDTEMGNIAKQLVVNGDVNSLSICANKLQQKGSMVKHGQIREVSLVLAGSNPGATIDVVMCHNDSDDEEAIIYTGLPLELCHSDEYEDDDDDLDDVRLIDLLTDDDDDEDEVDDEEMAHSDDEEDDLDNVRLIDLLTDDEDEDEDDDEDNEEEMSHSGLTLQGVLATYNQDQKDILDTMIGQAFEHGDIKPYGPEVKGIIDSMNTNQRYVFDCLVGEAIKANNDNKKEDYEMNHNIFDNNNNRSDLSLTHADTLEICRLAKDRSIGSLQAAIKMYVGEDTLEHAGFYDTTNSSYVAGGMDVLFPEFKDILKNPPEFIEDRDGWVSKVINGVTKSPISRIRTRQTDIRQRSDLHTYYDSDTPFPGNRGKGYVKGAAKTEGPVYPLLIRTTDPQTVYRKDSLHRDDIVDITDFDVVAYQYMIMKKGLEFEIARAILLGDGRLDNDPDKISQEHIRSIFNDVAPYVIRKTLDFDSAAADLQGTDTTDYFGDSFIKAEVLVTELLKAKIDYRGSNNMTGFCKQEFINTMLLARDRDGHRMYNSVADVCAALGVKELVACEEFGYATRTEGSGVSAKTMAPVAIFFNLGDYTVGSTRGGEITKFNQFDIDYNKEKYLIEARISGALTRAYSAIVLEEDVTP